MGKAYGKFKYKKGDIIQDSKRSLEIVDSYYKEKKRYKNGKEYTLNEKWYTYKCLNCGNVSEIREDSLTSNKSGCNVCCDYPKKIIKGVNDISTTAPWMMKYIVDKNYAYTNAKYSKEKTLMICPDCGKEHYKSAYNVYANHGLACICSNGVCYPNKFLHSLLEQSGIPFETEKVFPWSNKRLYDGYIYIDGRQILIEMHGIQHYKRCINYKSRTLEEERQNDEFKKRVALENGIDEYYVINSSISDCEFIKKSIIESGLLDSIGITSHDIDWNKCDEFATSNLYKKICEYHEANVIEGAEQVAFHFKVSRQLVSRAIKAGLKFGWCTNTFKKSRKQFNTIKSQSPEKCHGDFFIFKEAS